MELRRGSDESAILLKSPRGNVEEARSDKWTRFGFAGQIRGHSDRRGTSTMSIICTGCDI